MLIELNKTLVKLNWKIEETNRFKESTLLKLDCNKARNSLNWTSTLNFKKYWHKLYVNLVFEYLKKNKNLKVISKNQILEFDGLRKNKKL